jgi:hypothetical protein
MSNIDYKLANLFTKARNEQNLVSIDEARSLIENMNNQGNNINSNVKQNRKLSKMNIISMTIAAAAISGWITFSIFNSGDISKTSEFTNPKPSFSNSDKTFIKSNAEKFDGNEIKSSQDISKQQSENKPKDNKLLSVTNEKQNITTRNNKPENLQSLELTSEELGTLGIIATPEGRLEFTAFSNTNSPVRVVLKENDVAANFNNVDSFPKTLLAPVFITDEYGNRILSLFKTADGRDFLSFEKDVISTDLKFGKILKNNNIKKVMADVKIDIQKHKDLIDKNIADKELKLDEIEAFIKTIVDESMQKIDNKVVKNKKIITTFQIDSLKQTNPNIDSILQSLNVETDFSGNGRKAKIFISSKVNDSTNEEEIEIENISDTADLESNVHYSDNMYWNEPDSSISVLMNCDSTLNRMSSYFESMDFPFNDTCLTQFNKKFKMPDSLILQNGKILIFNWDDTLFKFNNKKFYFDFKNLDTTLSNLKNHQNLFKNYLNDSLWQNYREMLPKFDTILFNTDRNKRMIIKKSNSKEQSIMEKKFVIDNDVNKLKNEFDEYTKVNKFIAVSIADNNKPGFKYILWFEPTLDFIEKVPGQYREKLIEEYNASKTNELCNNPAIAGEETYFDIWKACSGAIENLGVYPNPVSGVLNMKFNLTEPRLLSVMIHDLSGKLITSLKSNTRFQQGEFNESVKVDYLEPGMYILSVQSEKGEKAIQRFIVE